MCAVLGVGVVSEGSLVCGENKFHGRQEDH